MAQLYNYKTGVWEDVDDTQIPDLVASGSHGLEANQELQMVDRNGEQWKINSNEAAKAFRDGYRFANAQDLSQQFDADLASQRKERFDSPLTAGVSQALGAGTMGLFDVAGRAVDEYRGTTDFVDARKGFQDENKKATVAGEVGGIIANTLLTGGAGLAAKAGIAGAKAGVALTGEAASVLSRLAPKVLSGAAENAVWGLGTGISEAALGRPENVVDNLVSHVGMGALIGGGVSGLFNGARIASPFFDNAVEGASNMAARAVSRASEALGKPILKSSLKNRGVNNAGEVVEDLFSPQGRQVQAMDASGELGALEKEASAVSQAAEKAALKERKVIVSAMGKELKKETKDVRRAAELAIAESEGSVQDASTRLFENYRAADEAMITHARDNLAEQYAVDGAGAAYKRMTEKAIKRLGVIGDAESQATARELQGMVDNYVSHIEANPRAVDEVIAFRSLREKAGKMIKADTSEGRDSIRQLYADSSKFLQNYPDDIVAGFERDTVSNYKAYNTLKKFFSKQSNISEYFFDPAAAPEVAEIIHNFKEVLPEMQAFQAASRDVRKQIEIADKAYGSYVAAKRAAGLQGQEISPEAFKEAFKHFGASLKGDVKAALERHTQLSAALDNPALTPTDRAVLLAKLVGQDTKALEQLAPLAKTIKSMNTLKDAAKGDRGLGQAIGDAAGDAAAFATGGYGLMAAKRAAVGAYRDPVRMLNAINAVDRAAQAGAQKISALTKKVAAGLISNASEKLTARSISSSSHREKRKERRASESMADQRARYQRMSAQLGKLADPQVFMNSVANATRGLEEMPALKAAITTKLESSLAIMTEALPVNPLAGKSLFPNKTPYQPPDYDIARYNRVCAVVENPSVAIERIASGDVTKDEVDTLRKAYPDIYNQLQSDMISAMMSAEQDIPYQKKLLIEQVFGIPVDYAMTPEFTAKMQANLTASNEGGRPDGAKDTSQRKPRLNLKPFEMMATETEQLQKDV